MLRTGEFTASCLWIFRYEELAYLKVWERQTLRLAETFIAPTGEDLLFYVRELTQELQIEKLRDPAGRKPDQTGRTPVA